MFLAWEFVEGGLLGSVSPHLFILSLSESAHSVLFNKLLSAPLCTRNCDGTYCLFPPRCTLTYPHMHTHTLRAKVSEFKHQISKGKNKSGQEGTILLSIVSVNRHHHTAHHTRRQTLNIQMPVIGPLVHCLDLLQTQPLR